MYDASLPNSGKIIIKVFVIRSEIIESNKNNQVLFLKNATDHYTFEV